METFAPEKFSFIKAAIETLRLLVDVPDSDEHDP